METFDSIKTGDHVTVTIWGPQNETLYKSTFTGNHRIDEAINEAISNADLQINPQDCVFEVTNDDTGVSHKYRFNAHDNLKLII